MYDEDKDSHTPPKRQYPPFYEKVVPIALGIIGVAIIILLLIIIGVALGLVTVQVGARNEPRTTSGAVIASEAKQSPAFNCHETGDCFVAPLLAMTPPERLLSLFPGGG